MTAKSHPSLAFKREVLDAEGMRLILCRRPRRAQRQRTRPGRLGQPCYPESGGLKRPPRETHDPVRSRTRATRRADRIPGVRWRANCGNRHTPRRALGDDADAGAPFPGPRGRLRVGQPLLLLRGGQSPGLQGARRLRRHRRGEEEAPHLQVVGGGRGAGAGHRGDLEEDEEGRRGGQARALRRAGDPVPLRLRSLCRVPEAPAEGIRAGQGRGVPPNPGSEERAFPLPTAGPGPLPRRAGASQADRRTEEQRRDLAPADAHRYDPHRRSQSAYHAEYQAHEYQAQGFSG